jgi:tetratricopeptide (TPR) repeat protein
MCYICPVCCAGEALSYLHRWVSAHPSYRDAAAAAGPPPDSSQALSHTVRLFEQVVASAPEDAELQLALGVLHHLNRRYDGAIAAFQRALELRPGDYRCVRVWQPVRRGGCVEGRSESWCDGVVSMRGGGEQA